MPAAIASLPMRPSTSAQEPRAVGTVADQEAQVVRPGAAGAVLGEPSGTLLGGHDPGVDLG